jgi:hypothetical protein
MLLVSRSGLVEEDAIEVFHYYGFLLSSSFLMYNFKSFQGKHKCGSIPVSFPHLHAVGYLVVHLPSRIVSHPKDKKLP